MTVDHIHTDDRLTFGCPGCIDQLRRSEYAAGLPQLSNDELEYVIIARDHMPDDWMLAAVNAEVARREDERRQGATA